MSQLTVKVPKGLAGGDTMQVEQNGSLFNVTVPPGLAAGDDFVVHVPSSSPAPTPPVYGQPATGVPAYGGGGIVTGQPAYGQPAQGPAIYGQPVGGRDPCRGCGRDFVRRPGVRPNTAQWYRCQECEGNITFCSIM